MAKQNLLIVDDEREFCEFVRKVATDLNFNVSVTCRAKDFRECYESAQPDVVVLDVIMPDTDGVELVQWLAERGYTGKTIVVTGFNAGYADATKSLGVARGLASITTLSKPVRLKVLREALQ